METKALRDINQITLLVTSGHLTAEEGIDDILDIIVLLKQRQMEYAGKIDQESK